LARRRSGIVSVVAKIIGAIRQVFADTDLALRISEFLEPLAISQYRLAKDVGVSPREINEIAHGWRAITADATLRLGLFWGRTPQQGST